jgi:hypothetical protein
MIWSLFAPGPNFMAAGITTKDHFIADLPDSSNFGTSYDVPNEASFYGGYG